MPDKIPEDMPDRMPEGMQDKMLEDMPEGMPDKVPEWLPEHMPEDLPDRMSERMSEDMPEDMPDRVPEWLPEHMPEDLPDRMSDRMSGVTAPFEVWARPNPFVDSCKAVGPSCLFQEWMSEDMPENMPDKMPEDMSDRMPEDLPVTKRIDVMVGITRSKVFVLIRCGSCLESCLVPFALYLQQFGTRTCHFASHLLQLWHVHLPCCTDLLCV